jgi:hypothetical protein
MEIFLAWSGEASHMLAAALHDWLPYVVSPAKPFMSSESVRKGQRWLPELSEQLEKTHYAILCVTPENLRSEWMHFEAGAVAKSTMHGRVSALLMEVAPSAVGLPLSQFQNTQINKDEVFKLVLSMDELLGAN